MSLSISTTLIVGAKLTFEEFKKLSILSDEDKQLSDEKLFEKYHATEFYDLEKEPENYETPRLMWTFLAKKNSTKIDDWTETFYVGWVFMDRQGYLDNSMGGSSLEIPEDEIEPAKEFAAYYLSGVGLNCTASDMKLFVLAV